MLVGDIVIDLAMAPFEIIDMHNLRQIQFFFKGGDQIRKSLELFGMEMDRLGIMEDGRVEDLRFDEVLEDMASV